MGPATLRGDQVLVPTAGGIVTLNTADGAVVTSANAAQVPDLFALAKVESIRSAMQQAGALELLTGDSDDKKTNENQPAKSGGKKRTR